MSGLRRALLDNAGLKAIAFAAGAVLFFVVRSEREAVTGGFVRVMYTYPRDRVMVGELPAEVRVSVRGPWAKVRRFDDAAVPPIRVDLGRADVRELRFTPAMVRLPSGLHVDRITPESARVEFDRRITRRVRVSPTIAGAPAAGHAIARVQVEPAAVEVSGAARVVEALAHVATAPVSIEGVRGTVVAAAELVPPPRNVEIMAPVDRARVTVRVVAETTERTWPGVPVQITGAARATLRAEPAAVDITVRGPRPVVDALTRGRLHAMVEAPAAAPHAGASIEAPVRVGGLGEGLSVEARPREVRLVAPRR